MAIIVLIGAIYMLVNGGLLHLILYLVIVGKVTTKFTDDNRRGGWWK